MRKGKAQKKSTANLTGPIWFVIPANRINAFEVIYSKLNVRGKDNLNDDEQLGMILDITGTKLMTGSTRMSDNIREELRGTFPPWVQVFREFPPVSAWEPPPTLAT